MTDDHDHRFDEEYWEHHWAEDRSGGPRSMTTTAANPHLVAETAGLTPGSALDVGCGAGAEAVWLAGRGWRVTGVDIAAEALAPAAVRAEDAGVADRVSWVRADLTTWEPDATFDLVTTHYAHAAMPQLALYERIASWVAPGGTLLVVGHAHAHEGHGEGHGHGHGHRQGEHDRRHPPAATVTAAAVAALLDPAAWQVVTAEQRHRTVVVGDGREVPLDDVVVRARRRA